MHQLIINADDFGYTSAVSYGILEAYRSGIVTSTTALTVSDAFEDAMVLTKKFPDLPIGVHLTLTASHCKPILGSEVSSLSNEKGEFWPLAHFLDHINYEEVEKEWDAQIQTFIKTGNKPSHLDSHHNVHCLNKELLMIALKLARKYQLPLRNATRHSPTEDLFYLYEDVPTPLDLYSNFYGESVNFETLNEIFKDITEREVGVYEMNCHPAFIDSDLIDKTSYLDHRIIELDILRSKKAMNLEAKYGVKLTNFETLK